MQSKQQRDKYIVFSNYAGASYVRKEVCNEEPQKNHMVKI